MWKAPSLQHTPEASAPGCLQDASPSNKLSPSLRKPHGGPPESVAHVPAMPTSLQCPVLAMFLAMFSRSVVGFRAHAPPGPRNDAQMTDTGPLFVSSGDLIADRRYQWALDQAARGDLAGAADILVQTVALAPAFAAAWFALGDYPRPARRPERRDRRLRKGARCRSRGLPRRAASARAARVRRRHSGDDRDLCPPAVRPVCRPLRRGAHRAPRLSRAGNAARCGRAR